MVWKYLKPKNISVPNKFPQFLIIELENGAIIYYSFADSIENLHVKCNFSPGNSSDNVGFNLKKSI